jgi:aminomethyltransferase
MKVSGGVALLGRTVTINGEVVGRVCSSGFSPFQGCGVCIVRMDDPAHGPGSRVKVEVTDGGRLPAELCTLPMYDEDRLIPRGKRVDIPTRPVAAE